MDLKHPTTHTNLAQRIRHKDCSPLCHGPRPFLQAPELSQFPYLAIRSESARYGQLCIPGRANLQSQDTNLLYVDLNLHYLDKTR